jgi:hypothetical protein
MPQLVAGWSRSLRERRSLFVVGSPAAKLRQLVYLGCQAQSPVLSGGGPDGYRPLRLNWKEAPLWGL